jgi:hypothetical protein
MPHLHLPAEHSEADLVLAANLADVVGSEDLYVAWTHDTGAGAVPEVDALLRAQRPSLLAEIVGALALGFTTLWRGLFQAPAAPPRAAAPSPAPRAGEPSA